jgi:uncharacterized protein
MRPKVATLPPIEKLRGIFAKYPEIMAAYLFGSQASGQTHHESDLDIALFPRLPTLREQKLDLLKDLAGEGFDTVDLVILDTDDIVLRFEAVHQNRLLYAAPEFDHASTFSKIIRQYFDFLPYLEVQRLAYKNRILNGQQGSTPKKT